MQRCDTPLLLAATRCAIDLAEVRGWSAATLTGVFYGLKAVLDGHAGGGPVPLSQVRQRARPRRHSSATRIAEVLAELALLHEDTTAAIRTWINGRTGDLPAGFGCDVCAWLVVLLDGDTAHGRGVRTPPRSRRSAPRADRRPRRSVKPCLILLSGNFSAAGLVRRPARRDRRILRTARDGAGG